MTTPIRIGLLGASKIARGAVIAPARDDPRFVVAAVGARDRDRAAAYAEKHGIPGVAADYAALVARDDVDVVYNALPPAGHMTWTIAALEAGKPVLCEKPFARNAGEARSMVAAAEKAGLVLLEAFHYRLHNVMRRAEALLASGLLGRLTGGGAEFHAPIRKEPGELRWSAEQGGGGLMDLGCYPVHALRTLLKGEPTVTGAKATFEDGVDADLSADLAFPDSVATRIACSMTAPGFSAWLRLEGERGRLEIQNFLAPQIGCKFTTTVNGETTEHPTDGPTTYAAQLGHLHAVLREGAVPLLGGADAIANMTTLDAIYTAAGRP
ncbi:MAG TPA: Gfo/Idh/MocA family oxidoreductase [Caulobacteraceae bacterium]|nr:Gfo/Idh/MocA family oxidoreductase [Caulobacteraceae bacterium]